MLEDKKRMNFFFLFGCRPSTGVKANTTMVKDIFDAFIEKADRINFMVLLPHVFDLISGNDASFETVSSSGIKTIKLFHKHNIVSKSIGLVIANKMVFDDEFDNSPLCRKMIKYGLKLDQVHAFKGLSMSQYEEKITWVIEKTSFGIRNCSQLHEQFALVVIIHLGHGFFLESNKMHKSDFYCYDYDTKGY